ncbi:hypothetical protein ACP70R_001605 [Stipagrostis hirtigluma subsp. patula]
MSRLQWPVGSLVAAGAANAAKIWDPLHGPSGLFLADLGIGDWFGGLLYSAGQQANEAVQDQFLCAFGSGKDRAEAYGQVGQGLPVAATGLIHHQGIEPSRGSRVATSLIFSDFDPLAAAANLPSSAQAYLAGLTFALACCHFKSIDKIIGGSLLLTYSTGYVTPLLIAASFAGALQFFCCHSKDIRHGSTYKMRLALTFSCGGAFLLGGGVYTVLDRVFPAM